MNIKYLDQIAFPESYVLEDISGKRYKSVDDWVEVMKRRKKDKRYKFKKKYKRYMLYLKVVNTSLHRVPMSSLLCSGKEFCRENIDKAYSNADYIKLHFNKELTAIELIQPVEFDGVDQDESFIDPMVYFDGFRLDESKGYLTDYMPLTDYNGTLCGTEENPFCMANRFINNKILKFSFIYYGYEALIYMKDEYKNGILLFMLDATTSTICGAVPCSKLKACKSKRNNGYNRYAITFKDSVNDNFGNIRYIDALNEEDAIDVLKQSDEMRDGGFITEVRKLKDDEWF